MNIRAPQTSAPAAAPAPVAVSTPPSAPRAAETRAPESSFGAAAAPTAERLGTARSGPHVALPSMDSLVPEGRLTGPMEPSSPEAQKAVNTSMDFLNLRM